MGSRLGFIDMHAGCAAMTASLDGGLPRLKSAARAEVALNEMNRDQDKPSNWRISSMV